MNPGETLQGAAHRYELRALIGSGSFGEVWEAVQVAGAAGVRKRVVVKILAGQGLAWSEGAMRMRDEARMLALVHDPAVVQVYDVFELDGTWGLAMELVEGEDLRASVERGPVPAPLLLPILADIASGLAAVHEVRGLDGAPAKLVHRDIKPENIRVDIRGRGRLIDFGIAKGSFSDREARTREGQQSPGSLRYMAPERFHGFDVQAGDVYSLGIVLIEALLPDGLGAVRMITRERVEAYLPRIPSEVRELAAAMTAEAPEARPAAREAAGRMRALAEAAQRPVLVGTRAPEPSPPEPSPPEPMPTEPGRPPTEAPTARRRSGPGVGAAVLLALSLVGGAAAVAAVGYYVSQPAGSDNAPSGSAAPHGDVTTEAAAPPVSPGTAPDVPVAGASAESPTTSPEGAGGVAPGNASNGATPTGPGAASGEAGVNVGAAATVGAAVGSPAGSTPGAPPNTSEAGAGRGTAPSGSPGSSGLLEDPGPSASTVPGNGKDPSGAAQNAPVSGTGCVKVLAPTGATASLRASRSGASAVPSGEGPWFFAVTPERWTLTVQSNGATVGTLAVDVLAGQILTVSCYPPGGCSNKSPLGGPAMTSEPRCVR